MKKNFFKQQPSGPAFDVVLKVLELAHRERPEAAFISSLLAQYRERGGLSKKQLEGLHAKASKIPQIPAQHLATLQAIILKKHSKQYSELPATAPEKKPGDMPMVDAILARFPEHKRVLLFKAKLTGRQPLSALEKNELKRFHQLLIK